MFIKVYEWDSAWRRRYVQVMNLLITALLLTALLFFVWLWYVDREESRRFEAALTPQDHQRMQQMRKEVIEAPAGSLLVMNDRSLGEQLYIIGYLTRPDEILLTRCGWQQPYRHDLNDRRGLLDMRAIIRNDESGFEAKARKCLSSLGWVRWSFVDKDLRNEKK